MAVYNSSRRAFAVYMLRLELGVWKVVIEGIDGSQQHPQTALPAFMYEGDEGHESLKVVFEEMKRQGLFRKVVKPSDGTETVLASEVASV